MRYYNIPIFIPERACPFQCIYCDQQKITGQAQGIDYRTIVDEIETHLSTIPDGEKQVLVAFFGGTFTAMPMEEQRLFLELVQPFIIQKRIKGIRISTRPDYINQKILDQLRMYHVSHIELGAQSLVDSVLLSSGRGHNFNQVKEASALIKANGFQLGLQMMVGLPGDNEEFALETAQKIISLAADETRIYPTLVIRGTKLAHRFESGKYTPLTNEQAIRISANLFQLFHRNEVKVIRMGLYPDESMLSNEVVAGPDMHHFKEKVMSEIWRRILNDHFINTKEAEKIEISVDPKQLNFAIGFMGVNRKMLLTKYKKVKFVSNTNLNQFQFDVNYS
jgi:histone acetyltransferase (RNA polymerase elongator complex component)